MARNMNFFTEEEVKELQQAQRENISKETPAIERVTWTSPEQEKKSSKSKKLVLVGSIAACLLIVAGVAFFMSRPNDNGANRPVNTSGVSVAAQPTPEPTPEATPEPTMVPGPNVSKDDWFAMLVNAEKPIPDDYKMTDGEVVPGSGYWLDQRILEDFRSMVSAAKESDLQLKIVSGYRGNDVQQGRYNKQVQKLRAEGMDEETAKSEALHSVLPGGHSEHNLGLAVDLVSQNNQKFEEFTSTPEYEWLVQHAAEYGFIERYPVGKESVTGVEAKPYHWRYVGKELAAFLVEEGLTLDEYHSQYLAN